MFLVKIHERQEPLSCLFTDQKSIPVAGNVEKKFGITLLKYLSSLYITKCFETTL